MNEASTPASEPSAPSVGTLPPSKTPTREDKAPGHLAEFLYVYCVIDGSVSEGFGGMGIGGRGDQVYGSPYKNISAIVSLTDRRAFERNEENVLAHQHVIQDIFNRCPAVPLPFSTVVQNKEELEKLLESRYDEFCDRLEKLREIYRPTNQLNQDILESNVLETTTLESNLFDSYSTRTRGRVKR